MSLRTREDHEYTMTHPESWPADILPVRNKTTGQTGYLPSDAPLTVCLDRTRLETKTYESVDEMINAGWVVD
jgi:hypothetical protein